MSAVTDLNSDGVVTMTIPMEFAAPSGNVTETESDLTNEVVPYVGNQTDYVLPNGSEIWTGKYAILEIEGCDKCGWVDGEMQENGTMTLGQEDMRGAAVGEFEVIGKSGGMNMENVTNWENADERKGINQDQETRDKETDMKDETIRA